MPPTAAPALAFDDVRFRWTPDAAWSLDVPQLHLAAGEQVLVSGPSGGGKSTLLHLAAGLVAPTAGTVRVAGTDLASLAPGARDHVRGRHVGMIFQLFHLLHGFTAIENVMLGLAASDVPPREHRGRAAAALDELGIDRHDADADDLSVGQRQRVAVARAIVGAPDLLLADEPTASLDPEAAAVAMDLIQDAARRHGAALLCTSHDPAMPERFGCTLRMDAEGRVAETAPSSASTSDSGTPAEANA